MWGLSDVRFVNQISWLEGLMRKLLAPPKPHKTRPSNVYYCTLGLKSTVWIEWIYKLNEFVNRMNLWIEWIYGLNVFVNRINLWIEWICESNEFMNWINLWIEWIYRSLLGVNFQFVQFKLNGRSSSKKHCQDYIKVR